MHAMLKSVGSDSAAMCCERTIRRTFRADAQQRQYFGHALSSDPHSSRVPRLSRPGSGIEISHFITPVNVRWSRI